MPAFTLNAAVDVLLKKEFDLLRREGKAHDLMKTYHIDAVPFRHPDLDVWRDNFQGKEYHHKETNFIITGAIDDIWRNLQGKLHIVDYKATSTEQKLSLEDKYKQAYKKQIEVYQWIFRKGGFDIDETGYFVFANAGKNRPSFDGKLEFALSIISHEGDDSWIEPTLTKIKKCLESGDIPESSANCEYCRYTVAVNRA